MVKKVIINFDSSKASGPDCIPVVVLKKCETERSYKLTELFNMCLKESCFPDCWKVSSVFPIFKNVNVNLGSSSKCGQLKSFNICGITLVDVHVNWPYWFHFLILEEGQLITQIDCIIFLSPFLDVTGMSVSIVSFLTQLDYGILCLYNAFLSPVI